jgi:acetyl-CoA acetyltransferase
VCAALRCAAFCTDKDEGVRAHTTLEGLAKLKPAFSAYANHPLGREKK